MRKISFKFPNDLSEGPDLEIYLSSLAIEHCLKKKKQEVKVTDDYSLHFVIYGKGVLSVNDGDFVAINKGTVFLIYPGESYVYNPIQEDPWTYVWLSFRDDNFDDLMKLCGFTREKPYQKIEDFAEVRELLYRMLDDYEKTKTEKVILASYFLRLIAHLITSNKNGSEKAKTGYKRLRESLIYINCNYRLPLSTSEVAAANYISTSYLNYLFSSIVGMSFSSYLSEYRVTMACVFLQQSDLGIEEIAAAVGFKDSKYFARIFKKIKGVSPREYRKLQIQEDPFKWLKERGIDFH